MLQERVYKANDRFRIDFHAAHDLLRHALHASESIKSACLNLKLWRELYRTDQKEQIKAQNATRSHVLDVHDNDILACVQLLESLAFRADSNEARLRNEISLAFNLVNQRETKTVRIISVVTLFFLPATFVSTLFSMSFFNFQPPYDEGWGVSPKIWLYFAVAAPITALTFVLWSQLDHILKLWK